jgi:hypothetical protein
MLDGEWTLRFAEQVNFFREVGAIKNAANWLRMNQAAPGLGGQGG